MAAVSARSGSGGPASELRAGLRAATASQRAGDGTTARPAPPQRSPRRPDPLRRDSAGLLVAEEGAQGVPGPGSAPPWPPAAARPAPPATPAGRRGRPGARRTGTFPGPCRRTPPPLPASPTARRRRTAASPGSRPRVEPRGRERPDGGASRAASRRLSLPAAAPPRSRASSSAIRACWAASASTFGSGRKICGSSLIGPATRSGPRVVQAVAWITLLSSPQEP